MTFEEFEKLHFNFVAHMSLEHVHTITYTDDSGRLGFCTHTRRRKNGDFGKSYTHYRIDNKVYKSKEEFIEALKDFDINMGVTVPLFGRR